MPTIFKNNKKQVLTELEYAIFQALTACGMNAEGHAKVNITEQGAVDTGLLRNSITYAISGSNFSDGKPNISEYHANNGEGSGTYDGKADDVGVPAVFVGTNVHYAPYIEFGTGAGNVSGGRDTPWSFTDKEGNTVTTSGMPARPYIAPAVSQNQDEYKKIFEKYLSQVGKQNNP